ncbi:MAG: hypothetical protein U9N49_10775, partial [Campylobacterota bacterium]|nr:hypothetical protein [Campylobacterota bacterium]
FTVGYIVQKALSSDSIIKYQLQAKAFLEHYQAKLDSHTQEMLLAFSQIEQCSRMQKIALLFKYSFFKQGAIRNLGLMLKV